MLVNAPIAANVPEVIRWNQIQTVRSALNGPYHQALWDPVERQEHQRNFDKLASQISQSGDTILKAPASSTFVRWDQDGFSKTTDLDRTKGYFNRDTQYIQNFNLSDEKGQSPQSIQKKLATNRQEADYLYQFPDKMWIKRTEKLLPQGLLETFRIQNSDMAPHKVMIEMNTGFEDFFQIRAGADEKAAKLKPGFQTLQDRPNELNTQLFATTATMTRNFQTPNWFAVITTCQSNIPAKREETLNATQDKAYARWIINVPAKANNAFFSMDFTMRNGLAPTEKPTEPATNYVLNRMALPAIQVEISPDASGQAIKHLGNTLAVSAVDLQTLTLPVRNPHPENGLGSEFFPVSAGIPNYVALFGRDSLTTSLFTLPFQPEYAKQTLLALAAYQGQKQDPFTEEEPGKIMHELRHDELTRLGYKPYRPSYSTLDATPLFVILYDAYLQRTGDKAVATLLRPHVLAALQWLETHTQGNPNGFLMLRAVSGGEQNAKPKNIGWKDSEYALRHRLQNGKLIDPPYPVAPVEVQAQVQQAWQVAARLFPEKSADYLARSQRLKDAFQAFWMPRQQWPASALDATGKPVTSVASNGAQVLCSDLLTPLQARQMQNRALLADLLSGWGMRTLSANEPAYNPISYHNGTVWPHDNALIALGAKRNRCDALVQAISDQVLQAAKHFPENRLPELYAGLPKQSFGLKDAGILEYPETCTIQAWASASPYAFLTALLGLELRQRNGQPQIHFDNPSLPTGVNALEIRGIPLTPHQAIDIMARRNQNSSQIQIWLKPSNASGKWQPYQAQVPAA